MLTLLNEKQIEYIYTKKPNDNVTLKINRGKINKEIIITLGKK